MVQQEDPHGSSPEQPRERAGDGSRQSPAEGERHRQARQQPEQEHPVDEAGDRVGKQILGIAVGVGERVTAEDPSEMGVEEASEGTANTAAVVVGAVWVAGVVGVLVMLAVVGDPLDQGPLDRS